MKSKLVGALVAVPLLVASGFASADEPVTLTGNQMDTVTAGGTAAATALAQALGGGSASAATAVSAIVQTIQTFSGQTTTIGNDLSQSISQAAASS